MRSPLVKGLHHIKYRRHLMKPSFESDYSPSNLDLGSYQQNVRKYRDTATQIWHKECKKYIGDKRFNPEVAPPFFIDKYSFRSWLAEVIPTTKLEFTNIPEIDFSSLFVSHDETVRQSVVGSKILNTKAPSVDEPVQRSVFLDEQFGAWQRHLLRNGIALPSESVDWYFSVPLLEVYRNSVFYPRFPVLWGPNYFGRISDQDRDHILKTYGEGAVWDFYFLMMVCHEQSHLLQKGEPILNEIAHAILWIDFVLEQGLKPFQVNSETCKTCNIEAPFILERNKALKGLNYGLLYEDNLTYFEREVVGSEYSIFVGMTFLVHAGVLRYRYVTDLFCGLLAGDVDINRYLRANATSHVSEVLSAFVQDGKKTVARDLVKSRMPTFGAVEL